MQYSFLCLTEVVTEVGGGGMGRGIQEAFKEMLCFF